MTDVASLVRQSDSIVISNNEQFVYYAEFLKKVSAAIKDGEKLVKIIKEKISLYRETQEAERKKSEMAILRQARALQEPAIVTKAVPVVENVHYRHSWKWRVKNLRAVPAAYKIEDKAKINAAVKALGKDANIRGIEIYQDEVVVVRSSQEQSDSEPGPEVDQPGQPVHREKREVETESA